MKVLNLGETSLIRLLEKSIKENWDCYAFSDYGTSVDYTYGDVAQRIERLHLLYAELGIQPGDKIALCDKNSSNWGVTLISILTYGAVAVPVLSDFSVEQIENIYEHSEAKLLICSKRTAEAAKRIPAEAMLSVLNFHPFCFSGGEATKNQASGVGLADAVKRADEAFSRRYPQGMIAADVRYSAEDPETLALLSYTSGSTGRSKGVMLPYRSLWSNTMFADEKLGIPARSKVISLLPLAHMYGFAFEFMYEFCIGCHVHFLTKAPSPNVVVEAFNKVKPAIVIAVPLIVEKIVMNKIFPVLRKFPARLLVHVPLVREKFYARICNQLKAAFGGEFYEIIVGGAAFNHDVEKLLRRVKFPFTVGYGMTECGPIIAYEDWKTFAPASCGKGAPRMEVKIDSSEPERIPGEIICRGTNVMLGYYKNPEATAEALDADGWLHTGDLATMDSVGNIFIRGRKKSMLLGANGQNVYPEEIEDKVHSLTVFDECVVVQRADKLVALVYVSDSTLEANEMKRDDVEGMLDEYRRTVNQHLPQFSRIAAFEVCDEEFEKTPKKNIKRYLYH